MLPSGSLTVSPTSLDLRGTNVVLSWSSPLALSATIDNGIGAVVSPTTGSITQFVLFPTTFNMTFTNLDGNFVASANIGITADVLTHNIDSSITTQIFREIGAGLVAVNNVRLTGDGMPSYQIRSEYKAPITTAQVLWNINKSGGPGVAGGIKLTAIDVSNPAAPFLISDTLITDVDNGSFGFTQWAGTKNIVVDANHLYYYTGSPVGKVIVRATDVHTPAVVCFGTPGNISPGMMRYKNYIMVLAVDTGVGRPSLELYDTTTIPTFSKTFSTAVAFDKDNPPILGMYTQAFCMVEGKVVLFAINNPTSAYKELSAVSPSFGTWSQGAISSPDGDSAWYNSYQALASSGRYVYRMVRDGLTNPNNALQILDSTNLYAEIIPDGGRIIPPTQDSQTGNYLFVNNNYLFVFCNTGNFGSAANFIWVYGIDNPLAPVLTAAYLSPKRLCLNWRICFDGKYLYMFNSSEDSQTTAKHRLLTIYDITDVTNFVTIFDGTYDPLGGLYDVPIHTACGCYPNGFVTGGNSYIP
jgi:hypothetical protein